MTQDEPSSGVKSVKLAFRVLEGVSAAGANVGVSELADALKTTKGTVFRHLQTLMDLGYVSQDAQTARYSLGMRAQLLSQGAGRVDIMVTAEAEAKALRDEVGETCVVSLITAKSVVVATTALARAAIEIGVRPGSELSLHSTAQGKIALAFSRHPLLKRALANGLERYSETTICDVAALSEEIDRIRRQGFALAPEESARGISAVAAPIFDSHGDGVATIAIVGLAQSIKHPPNPQHVAALLSAAERISRNLGFRVEPDEHLDNPDSDPQRDKEVHAPHA